MVRESRSPQPAAESLSDRSEKAGPLNPLPSHSRMVQEKAGPLSDRRPTAKRNASTREQFSSSPATGGSRSRMATPLSGVDSSTRRVQVEARSLCDHIGRGAGLRSLRRRAPALVLRPYDGLRKASRALIRYTISLAWRRAFRLHPSYLPARCEEPFNHLSPFDSCQVFKHFGGADNESLHRSTAKCLCGVFACGRLTDPSGARAHAEYLLRKASASLDPEPSIGVLEDFFGDPDPAGTR